jgi:hypothetical protein
MEGGRIWRNGNWCIAFRERRGGFDGRVRLRWTATYPRHRQAADHLGEDVHVAGEKRGMEREHSGERVLARRFDTTPACPLGAAQCKPVQSGASNALICHGGSTPLRLIRAPGFRWSARELHRFSGEGRGMENSRLAYFAPACSSVRAFRTSAQTPSESRAGHWASKLSNSVELESADALRQCRVRAGLR